MSELYQPESRVAGDRLLRVSENFLRFHQLELEGEHMFNNNTERSLVWIRYRHTQLTDVIFTTRSTTEEELSRTRVIQMVPSQYGYGVLVTETDGTQHDAAPRPGITTQYPHLQPITIDVVEDLEWELRQPDLKMVKKRRERMPRAKQPWLKRIGATTLRGF